MKEEIGFMRMDPYGIGKMDIFKDIFVNFTKTKTKFKNLAREVLDNGISFNLSHRLSKSVEK